MTCCKLAPTRSDVGPNALHASGGTAAGPLPKTTRRRCPPCLAPRRCGGRRTTRLHHSLCTLLCVVHAHTVFSRALVSVGRYICGIRLHHHTINRSAPYTICRRYLGVRTYATAKQSRVSRCRRVTRCSKSQEIDNTFNG